MNACNAILAAAAHIDAHPDLFNFESTRVPRNCSTPACALGWIGFFAGRVQARVRGRFGFSFIHRGIAIVTADGSSEPVISVSAREFYERLDRLAPGNWREEARACAAAMRLYAERYHGATVWDEAYLAFRRDLYPHVPVSPTAGMHASGLLPKV